MRNTQRGDTNLHIHYFRGMNKAVPETTSAEAFERYVGGKCLVACRGEAWRDIKAWIIAPPAPRDEAERGGNRAGRGLRQSRPFRATLPPGNRPGPERLSAATVTANHAKYANISRHNNFVWFGYFADNPFLTFEQSRNRWSKSAGDNRAQMRYAPSNI
jgi:hypothetical protein